MTSNSKRLHGVDALRGFAILAVVVHHINIRFRMDKAGFGELLPHSVTRVLFWSGSYSVKVFFVVSGFLITSSILGRYKELNRIDLKQFYRYRFARIGPCLLALLLILSALHLLGTNGFVIKRATLPRALFAALTFHVNWLEAKVGYLPGSWDVLWSLSVEEAFYLAYPLICRFVKSRWILGMLVGVLLAAGPLVRTIWAANDIASDYAYLANTDFIALGCVAACITIPRGLLAVRIAGWSLFLLVMIFRKLDVTFLGWGTALIILGMSQGANVAHRWTAPLRWFGRNSYEVYLTHMFVVTCGTLWFAAGNWPVNAKWIWSVVMVALAGVLGALVARFYSEPMNHRLRF